MSNTYDIGQVVYVVSSKSQQVIPVQVVERIVKSTLNGEEIIYKVLGPKGEGPHDLRKLDGELFTDPNVVLHALQTKATNAVNKMVNTAITVATNRFKAPSPLQDGDLMLKVRPTQKAKPKPQPQTVMPIESSSDSKVSGEIELAPGPDGKPRKALVRSTQMGVVKDN